MEGRLTSRIEMDSLRAVEKQTLEMIADGAALGDVLTHLCDSIDSQVSPSVLRRSPELTHPCSPKVTQAF
jgi:hypothetical protein